MESVSKIDAISPISVTVSKTILSGFFASHLAKSPPRSFTEEELELKTQQVESSIFSIRAYKRGERQRRFSSKPRDPAFGTSFRRTLDDGWWNGEENKAPNPPPPVPATSFSTFYFYRRGNQRDISPSSCASSPPSSLFILRRRSSSRWPPAISFTVTTRTSTSW